MRFEEMALASSNSEFGEFVGAAMLNKLQLVMQDHAQQLLVPDQLHQAIAHVVGEMPQSKRRKQCK